MTLNIEEKTCCENATGPKNLWSEKCLKKPVDVEQFDREHGGKKKPVMSIHNGQKMKSSGHNIVKYKYKD